VRTGSGIDLAGYGKKGGTILAAIRSKNSSADVGIITDTAFAKSLRGASDLEAQLEEESAELSRLLTFGAVAVDVPIHLQDLPSLNNITRVWELTRRPIDRAFSGLAPLADKLGYCVARFRKLVASKPQFKIGERLFETYPAASLDLCQIPRKGYKAGEESPAVRLAITKELRILGPPLTHDELDAVICAITSIVDGDYLLEGGDLREEMLKRLKREASDNRHQVPDGYRLLRRKEPFSSIRVKRCTANEWFGRHP
jgi:hypothetical protein